MGRCKGTQRFLIENNIFDFERFISHTRIIYKQFRMSLAFGNNNKSLDNWIKFDAKDFIGVLIIMILFFFLIFYVPRDMSFKRSQFQNQRSVINPIEKDLKISVRNKNPPLFLQAHRQKMSIIGRINFIIYFA
jgi:hypothetical protein